MRYLFIYPYIAFCALFFYPCTVLIWLCEPDEMRHKGYFNFKEYITDLKENLK